MLDIWLKIIEFPHAALIGSFLLLFLSFNPINLYAMWRLHQRLERGESLPDRLENFPILPTSVEDYVNSWEKVENFKREVLKGNSSQLVLSSDDINHIYLKGIPINKYSVNNLYGLVPVVFKYSNTFLYFQVADDAILKKKVEYCNGSSIGMPDGVITETTETRYKNTDNGVLKHAFVVEWNGKKMDSQKDWTDDKFTASIRGSTLLTAILTGDFNPPLDGDINQRKLIASIIRKITQINISDGFLIIISNS
jgi:hypothetical protein